MSKIAIMQPFFFPWGGYFQLMNSCDYFIILDDVDLNSQSWQTRNYFYLNKNFSKISLPIKNLSNKSIMEAELDSYEHFKIKLLKTIQQNYAKKFPYTKDLFNILDKDYTKLININMDIINFFKNILSIKTKLIFSSELQSTKNINSNLKSAKIENILKNFENPVYIITPGSMSYMDIENFDYCKYKSSGIVYNKIFFNPPYNFNILDLIAIHGKDKIINNL